MPALVFSPPFERSGGGIVTPPPAPVGTLPSNAITSSVGGTVPFTMGVVFTAGALPSGSSLAGLQLDVKNAWPDGSVKFGLLSGLKAVTAGVASAVALAALHRQKPSACRRSTSPGSRL